MTHQSPLHQEHSQIAKYDTRKLKKKCWRSFAYEKFAHYIYGQLISVQSYHKPLEAVFNKSTTATKPKLQRMLLRLLKFQLGANYLPGKSVYIADTLFHAYLTELSTRSDRELSDDIEVTVHTVLHETSINKKNIG